MIFAVVKSRLRRVEASCEHIPDGCLCAQDMELEDAVHTALLTLKEGFEGQISGHNIEVAIVGEDQKFRVLTPAEVSDYLEEVE